MERYLDSSLSHRERAEDLLRKMTLEEKMGQVVGYNPAIWSADDLERDYPYGAGHVSCLDMQKLETAEEAAAYQRRVQDSIMAKSPHHIPALFHMEGLCGVLLRETVTFPSVTGRCVIF